MPDLDSTLAAASKAVSGPDTPEAIHTTQAVDSRLIWALVGAAPIAAGLVLILAHWLDGYAQTVIRALAARPDATAQLAAVALAAVQAVSWVSYGVVVCLGLVFWRFAGVKHLDAKAGPVAAVVDG